LLVSEISERTVPTTGNRYEDHLIDIFLSVYEGRRWAGDLSSRESPGRVFDGGVASATQLATGRTLAIEHTIIEPFVGEKKDFFENFQELQERCPCAI
jgi:hypothetical protein